MTRLGIIPAAGKAYRFNGVYKELLPCEEGTTFLRRTYSLLRQYCDAVVLVTNEEKICAHARELGSMVIYMLQPRGKNTIGEDIMGAIYQAMTLEAERYYFAMPDTYLPQTAFYNTDSNVDFQMGVFETYNTERFGILQDDVVLNKRPGLSLPAKAWGVLIWSERVRRFWLEGGPTSYTEAFNLAIKRYGYSTFDLEYYYDIASFEDYKKYLKKENNERVSQPA